MNRSFCRSFSRNKVMVSGEIYYRAYYVYDVGTYYLSSLYKCVLLVTCSINLLICYAVTCGQEELMLWWRTWVLASDLLNQNMETSRVTFVLVSPTIWYSLYLQHYNHTCVSLYVFYWRAEEPSGSDHIRHLTVSLHRYLW